MSFRRFKQRFGIAAPKVAIRRYIAWQWYAFGLLGLMAAVSLLVLWLTQQGGAVGQKLENDDLRRQLALKVEDLQRFSALAATERNALEMERSAQQQLLARIRALEQERAKLKEELSLLERLVKECPDGKRRNGAANDRTGG